MPLPTITITGRLTADPELRFTPSGQAVANFTIAANDRRLNKQTNEWEDGDSIFLNCTIWRDKAEAAAELRKGQPVIATGKLKQRSYTTREGEKRTVIELDADALAPLPDPKRGDRGSGAQTWTPAATPAVDQWAATNPAEPPF